MKRKVIKKILVMLFATICTAATGLTPTEIYTDAENAYKMGNFSESEELFSRFCKLWPEHKLYKNAKRLKLLSQARNIDSKIRTYRKQLVNELEEEFNALDKELNPEEKTEIQMTLDYAANNEKVFDWKYLQNLSNENLLRVFVRNWNKSPTIEPIESLKFINEKLMNEQNTLDPRLESHLLKLKALALWQLVLSPLPQHANSRILDMWNDWPVHNALEKTINKGFSLSDDNLKREFALLGLHFDCFRHKAVNELSDLKSRWFDYLRERGLHEQEAWAPR